MKRALLIACGLLPGLAHAFTVNFHAAGQGYAHYNGYNVLYYGQGAVSDPGNNVWNGFGNYSAGGGSFYGPTNPNSGGVGKSVPNGLVGNPYAWAGANTGSPIASGANLFDPTNPGAGNVGNATSSGLHTPITLSLNYDVDENSSGPGGATQGSPAWVLNTAAKTFVGHTGTFTLGSVPVGTYTVVLYGVNFAGTKGASFTLSSGTAVGGLTQTLGGPEGSPANSFVLGDNYVEFVNVQPDGSGNISGTWTGDNAPTDEGFFNGVQIVQQVVPEPSTIGLLGLGAAAMLAVRRRRK